MNDDTVDDNSKQKVFYLGVYFQWFSHHDNSSIYFNDNGIFDF